MPHRRRRRLSVAVFLVGRTFPHHFGEKGGIFAFFLFVHDRLNTDQPSPRAPLAGEQFRSDRFKTYGKITIIGVCDCSCPKRRMKDRLSDETLPCEMNDGVFNVRLAFFGLLGRGRSAFSCIELTVSGSRTLFSAITVLRIPTPTGFVTLSIVYAPCFVTLYAVAAGRRLVFHFRFSFFLFLYLLCNKQNRFWSLLRRHAERVVPVAFSYAYIRYAEKSFFTFFAKKRPRNEGFRGRKYSVRFSRQSSIAAFFEKIGRITSGGNFGRRS